MIKRGIKLTQQKYRWLCAVAYLNLRHVTNHSKNETNFPYVQHFLWTWNKYKWKIRDFNQKYSKSGAFPLPRKTVSYLTFIIRDRLMNLWLN